jgi:uncharacterized protein (TIGR03083 family)
MTPPPTPPRELAPLLHLERQRLLGLLGGLSESQWALATPCPGWTALDLARHLVGDDLGWIAFARDEHRGSTPDATDEAGFVRWLDELQREWVQAAQRLSAPLVLDLLRMLDPMVVEVMAAQDPTACTAHVSWASDQSVPQWLDQGRELTERWLHRQQLLQALGEPSDLRGDLLDPVLDTLRWAYPFRLDETDRPEGTTISIDLTDAPGAGPRWRWTIVRVERSWTIQEDGHDGAAPAAQLWLSTEQAWRLLSNNFRVAEGADRRVDGRTDDDGDDGEVVAAGDLELLDVLLHTRAIIGTPGPTPRFSRVAPPSR